jgi:hypothetical protein
MVLYIRGFLFQCSIIFSRILVYVLTMICAEVFLPMEKHIKNFELSQIERN